VVAQIGIRAVKLAAVSLNRIDDLTHGQDDPTHLHKLLAHPIGPLLDLAGHGLLVEQAILKRLDRVVHELDGLEVAIHDDVEQAMKQLTRNLASAARGHPPSVPPPGPC
jgi:hypothetical protein